MSSESSELLDLASRYLDSQTSEEETARLADILRRDPEARVLAARLLNQHVALRFLGAEPGAVGVPPLAAVEPRRFRWPAWAPLAAAAAVLAVAGVWWTAGGGKRQAASGDGVVARNVEGSAFRVRGSGEEKRPLAEGDQIRVGERIETGVDGRVTLAWAREATTVQLGGEAGFRVQGSGKSVLLDRGALTASVAKQGRGRSFVVETPHARASVVGTWLSLDVQPDRTRLEVLDGKVRFSRLVDGRELDVAAGRWALFGDATRFAVGALDIALDSGLAGWWKLDETGGTNVLDSSGHGHHGRLVQRQYMTARELRVNATNICVKIEGGLSPGTNGWTVALWFKSTAYSAGSQSLYSQIGLCEAHVKDGRLSYLWSPSTGWVGDKGFPVSLGRWHHVAVVYDTVKRILYKDGAPVFSEEVTGDMGVNTNPLLLSARAGSDVPYQFFNGELADVRIYSRALSPAEVATLASRRPER